MDIFDRYRGRTVASLLRRVAEGALPADLDLGRFAVAPAAAAAPWDIVVDAALVYARPAAASRRDPLDLAGAIARDLADDPCSGSVEVAGRGFVNVTLRPAAILDAVSSLLRADAGLAGAVAEPVRHGCDLSLGEARARVAAEQRAALSAAADGMPPRDGAETTRPHPAPATVPAWAGEPGPTAAPGRATLAGVDPDAFRFAVAARRPGAALPLEPAAFADRSNANPAFWVPYAHARLRGVLRRAAAAMPDLDLAPSALAGADLSGLVDAGELGLARLVIRHPHVVATAAAAGAPHRLAAYLCDLAAAAHSQWNRSKDQPQLRFVNEEERVLSEARLGLVTASTLVLRSGLGILGVTAPDEMA